MAVNINFFMTVFYYPFSLSQIKNFISMNFFKQYAEHKALFKALRHVIENTESEEIYFDKAILVEKYNALESVFEDDCKRMADIRVVIFGEDYEDFGAQGTKIFADWEKQGGGPSLTAMVAAAIVEFNLNVEKENVQACFVGAVLAEYPNDLQYHGNEHYRKVLIHKLRLIGVHNGIYDGTNRILTPDHIATLLTASCVHDLGHEGGDNLRDGVYTPGQLETFAIALAKPFFKALPFPADEMAAMEAIVFCTDITFFAGDNSPCVRMKKIYKHFFWDDDREDVQTMMVGKLRQFQDNPRLVMMAMLLHEADIATSAGLSYEQTIKETISILEERGLQIAGPKTVLAFLREQLGETMFSDASKRLYGRVIQDVIARAEQDLEAGRQTYYEDKST